VLVAALDAPVDAAFEPPDAKVAPAMGPTDDPGVRELREAVEAAVPAVPAGTAD
jgi:hypothetical protein